MPVPRHSEGRRLAAGLSGGPAVSRVSQLKTLLILRHGKSSWADPTLADHDRPLKKRGRRGARSIGEQLCATRLPPDLVLSSTARRARGTAKRCLAACGGGGRLALSADLYGTGAGRHLEVVAEQAGDADAVVMVVGHNPDLEQLVARLTGEPAVLKTAYLAVIDLEIARWSELADAGGRLRALLTPAPG